MYNFIGARYGVYIWTEMQIEGKTQSRIIGITDVTQKLHAHSAWECVPLKPNQKVCDSCKHVYCIVKCAYQRYKRLPPHSPLRIYDLGKVSCSLVC